MFNKIKEWLSPKKYGGGLSYGNVGTHVLPIQATTSDVAIGIGSAATVTYPAIIGKSNCISGISYSYSGALGGAATFYPLTNSAPFKICNGPDGNLWVVDVHSNSLWKVTTSGVGTPYPIQSNAYGICAGPDGNLWGTDNSTTVYKMTTNGTRTDYTLAGAGSLLGICAGPDGNLWACDGIGGAGVWKVTTSGVGTNYPFGSSSQAYGICAGPDGNLWVADAHGAIWKVTTAGSGTQYTLSPGPQSICVGADGNLWAGTYNGNVWQMTINGISTEFTLNGSSCTDICTGPDGNVWVSDQNGGKAWKVMPSGVGSSYLLLPISGVGAFGICSGSDGNLWIADGKGFGGNGGVWKIFPNALLTISDGNTIIREFIITQEQGTITFPSPIKGSIDTAMTVTLSAGGPNINGTLNINGFFTV